MPVPGLKTTCEVSILPEGVGIITISEKTIHQLDGGRTGGWDVGSVELGRRVRTGATPTHPGRWCCLLD